MFLFIEFVASGWTTGTGGKLLFLLDHKDDGLEGVRFFDNVQRDPYQIKPHPYSYPDTIVYRNFAFLDLTKIRWCGLRSYRKGYNE